MRRELRLTSGKSFSLIYEEGASVTHPLLVLKFLSNGLDRSRFAFITSKRLGNAVVRNQVRRRLRELARLTPVKPGWDAVVIVRRRAVDASYQRLKQAIESLLRRARLLETPLPHYGDGV